MDFKSAYFYKKDLNGKLLKFKFVTCYFEKIRFLIISRETKWSKWIKFILFKIFAFAIFQLISFYVKIIVRRNSFCTLVFLKHKKRLFTFQNVNGIGAESADH